MGTTKKRIKMSPRTVRAFPVTWKEAERKRKRMGYESISEMFREFVDNNAAE